MSTVHLHLMLNHLPLFGLLFGGGLLLYARIWPSDFASRAGLVFFVLAGLGTVGTYMTGEGAEHAVEGQTGVLHSTIEAHEEVALFALILAGGLALLSLGLLVWYRRRSIPRTVTSLLLVLTLVALVSVGYTAYTGGQINHPELRGETTEVSESALPAVENEE